MLTLSNELKAEIRGYIIGYTKAKNKGLSPSDVLPLIRSKDFFLDYTSDSGIKYDSDGIITLKSAVEIMNACLW